MDSPPPMSPPPDLFAAYEPPPGAWDEAMGPQGLRSGWSRILEHLTPLGGEGLDHRQEQIRHLVRDNGVAYTANISSGERPWRLDPLPMAIPAEDWRTVCQGVAQRARLLEAYLEDVYGPQVLVREGVLHPNLILGHPQFLRPVHGVAVPGRLQVYAADLVRTPEGAWQVTTEHTQTPAGAGFALENRIVLSRALADVYRMGMVERLAGFFMTLRASLRALAPAHRDNPRMVLLTPGPAAETYFEHAFLARYLGLTLVEGADLTVRNDQVFLKTLGGLHQVDVILRRLGDDWCDPLELRGDSLLGVAGLVSAVRAGQVTITNALGSGVGEHLGLLAHGPVLCRRLLDEHLLLDAVPTHWGGADARAVVDPGPNDVLRPAHGVRAAPISRQGLSKADATALTQRILRAPQRWVAQTMPPAATVPVWTPEGLVPRPATLRVFACRDAQGRWQVMPGALVRVTDDQEQSFDRGGIKDLWVIADHPVEPVSLLNPASAPVRLLRGGVDLPSRVADNLFWTGRYAERLEDNARLLRAGLTRLADDPRSAGPALGAIAAMADRLGLRPKTRALDLLPADIKALAFDPKGDNSLPAIRHRLQRSAAAVRDRVSNDTWRIITRLDQDGEVPTDLAQAITDLDHLLMGLSALAGMGTENTTRGPAWRFLELGRRMERAQFALDLLRAVFIDTKDAAAGQEVALEIFDSSITYRTRYLTAIQAAPVLDLLLVDGTNPRSVAFQVARLGDHLTALPAEEDRALPTACERHIMRLRTAIDLTDAVELCSPGRAADLVAHLESIAQDLTACSDAITAHYLSHATARRSPA